MTLIRSLGFSIAEKSVLHKVIDSFFSGLKNCHIPKIKTNTKTIFFAIIATLQHSMIKPECFNLI